MSETFFLLNQAPSKLSSLHVFFFFLYLKQRNLGRSPMQQPQQQQQQTPSHINPATSSLNALIQAPQFTPQSQAQRFTTTHQNTNLLRSPNSNQQQRHDVSLLVELLFSSSLKQNCLQMLFVYLNISRITYKEIECYSKILLCQT